MPQTTLTVRVKALDEATPKIKKIQDAFSRAFTGASALGGAATGMASNWQKAISGGGAAPRPKPKKEGEQAQEGGAGSAVTAGIVGGGVAGLITVAFGFIKDILGKIWDVGKKLWNVMSEASGQMKAVNALWQNAILNVFRPLGDAIGMALLPATVKLTQTTAENYAKFLDALANGADMTEALDQNMEDNIQALGTYFEVVLNTMAPIIAKGIGEWTPTMIDAVAEGIEKWFSQQFSIFGEKSPIEKLDAITNAGFKGLFGPVGGLFAPDLPFSNYNPSTPVAPGGSGFTLNWFQDAPIYGVDELEQTINRVVNNSMTFLQGGG